MRPLRDLLIEPVAALGSADIGRDVEAVSAARSQRCDGIWVRPTGPAPRDIEHLVRFCLLGLGVR